MENRHISEETPDMDHKALFGVHLRELRSERGLTQETFAERIGRSTEAISNIERGDSLPNLETLARISSEFEIPLRDLVYPLDPHATNDPERARLEAQLLDLMSGASARTMSKAVRILRILSE